MGDYTTSHTPYISVERRRAAFPPPGGHDGGWRSLLQEARCTVGRADADGAAAEGAVESHAVHVGLRVGGGLRMREHHEGKAARLRRILVAYHLHECSEQAVS